MYINNIVSKHIKQNNRTTRKNRHINNHTGILKDTSLSKWKNKHTKKFENQWRHRSKNNDLNAPERHAQNTTPITMEYTFFWRAHEIFINVDHIQGYKTNLNTVQRIEIVEYMFPDHKGTEFEINTKTTHTSKQ